jgi:hypothetical protein
MSNTRWYMESWSVTDGLAFASERTEDGTVVNVVFLAPPYWSPVAVANVSTAWAAHRASFQRGFFDAEGENEIAFASLAEIREALRRAYLASGYGTFPSGEGGEGGEIAPLPGGDGGEGGGRFNEIAERLSSVVDADSRQALADSLQTFYRREAASSEMPASLARYVSSQTQQAARLAEMGGKAERHFFAALTRASVYVLGDYSYEPPYPWWWWTMHRTNPSSILTMIFRMPIRRHNGRVEMLGDHLALAASSRAYLSSIRRPADLLPLFLGALFISAANDVPWYGVPLRQDMVDEACRWLAANVPGVIRDDHPASALLEQFVITMRDEGPAAVRPSAHLSAAIAT